MDDTPSPTVRRAMRHFWLLYFTYHPERRPQMTRLIRYAPRYLGRAKSGTMIEASLCASRSACRSCSLIRRSIAKK